MYSCRQVNSLTMAQAAVGLSARIPAREFVVPGIGGVLTNRNADFGLDGRDAWIFISIKNRSFNRIYVNRFIDLCEGLGINGYICPVDDPYRYNSMAELKVDILPPEEAAKIERLSTDITRMAQKAINGKCSKRVELVKWRDLEAETPPVYREELTAAFKDKTRIRNLLYEHISAVKSIEDDADFARFAEFFLCEVPVLMYAYYSKSPTLDIYPGPQPAFFWQIEMGLLEDELPMLTALTRAGRAMSYLDTHDRSGARN